MGRNEKESGGGSEEDGVIVGRMGVNRAMRVEEGVKKGKTRIGKAFMQCKKGRAEGETRNIPRKIPRN